MTIQKFRPFRQRRAGRALAALALVAAAIAVAVVVVVVVGKAAWRIKLSAELARQSEALQASPPGATGRLLIVGDSTAVGTGASSAANSLAGLIAREHPGLRIINRAADGARFADIARQLDGQEQFDLILVLGGGNDVIRMTGEPALAQNIERVLELARKQAGQVIVMPPGNVGNAPFFFAPLSWLMTQRAQTLHTLVRQAAAASEAVYVNLYLDKADDPFAQRPEALNAPDGLHPSDAGYQVWFQALNTQAALASRLAGLR